MNVTRLIDLAFVVLGAVAGLFASAHFVHMLQLESYQANMYLKWLWRNIWRDWLPTILVFVICALFDAALPIIYNNLGASVSGGAMLIELSKIAIRLIYALLMIYIVWFWAKMPSKKPLVFTGRVKRLFAAIAVIFIIINLIPQSFNMYSVDYGVYLAKRYPVYLPALLLPMLVLLAHFITYPIEEGIKRYFFNDAKRILQSRSDLIKIGITGSYGKTSAKFALGAILSEKFDTLITPHSYNTPMGITRVTREMLKASHEVFVAEMGARYTGDIEELCDLVKPTIGLLTSVGKQHLETFGSQKNVNETKYELIGALPPDGAAFFNGDNAICLELYKRKAPVHDKFLYGISCREEVYMRAVEISSGPNGSVFTLVTSNNESIECRTRMLGEHNILNITGCAAVAHYMGLTMQQIAAGIRKLEPVEHRLQLIPGPITVIDDAFNSNPAGAQAAMDVLRTFPGRRIVVTPGMVELGSEEEEQNEKLGELMAMSADIAILVGKKRSVPIVRGMKALEFSEENTYVVSSLDEASAILAEIGAPGDVVLFENDLPDNYNE